MIVSALDPPVRDRSFESAAVTPAASVATPPAALAQGGLILRPGTRPNSASYPLDLLRRTQDGGVMVDWASLVRIAIIAWVKMHVEVRDRVPVDLVIHFPREQ